MMVMCIHLAVENLLVLGIMLLEMMSRSALLLPFFHVLFEFVI